MTVHYWSCKEEDDNLMHHSPKAAIEEYLDETPLEDWTLNVKVFGFDSRGKPLGTVLEGVPEWVRRYAEHWLSDSEVAERVAQLEGELE